MSKKKKIRCYLQERKLRGKSIVIPLGDGLFVYRRELFNIDDFPPNATINLDKTTVLSYGYYEVKKPSKKKSKRAQKNKYHAHLFSNAEDCPDVKETIEAT